MEKINPATWIAAHAAKRADIGPSTCIGVISEPCQEVDDSTMGLAECARREYAAWDERLNTAYKTWISKCDNTRICEARRKYERAWIAYQGTLCALPRIETEGTISIVEGAECVLGATARQTIWIEQQNAMSDGI